MSEPLTEHEPQPWDEWNLVGHVGKDDRGVWTWIEPPYVAGHCRKCGAETETTLYGYDNHGSSGQMWCEPCILRAKIAYNRYTMAQCAERLPGLEARLKEIEG